MSSRVFTIIEFDASKILSVCASPLESSIEGRALASNELARTLTLCTGEPLGTFPDGESIVMMTRSRTRNNDRRERVCSERKHRSQPAGTQGDGQKTNIKGGDINSSPVLTNLVCYSQRNIFAGRRQAAGGCIPKLADGCKWTSGGDGGARVGNS